MQTKEFKDFIKEADNKNDVRIKSFNALKERFRKKIDSLKEQYKIFQDNYFDESISEFVKKYELWKTYGIVTFEDNGSTYTWYIDFRKLEIICKSVSIGGEDTFIEFIEHWIERFFEYEYCNSDIANDYKEDILKIETVLNEANEKIGEMFEDMASRVENELTEDINEYDAITFDDDDTEQVVKKYKVTINIEEV